MELERLRQAPGAGRRSGPGSYREALTPSPAGEQPRPWTPAAGQWGKLRPEGTPGGSRDTLTGWGCRWRGLLTPCTVLVPRASFLQVLPARSRGRRPRGGGLPAGPLAAPHGPAGRLTGRLLPHGGAKPPPRTSGLCRWACFSSGVKAARRRGLLHSRQLAGQPHTPRSSRGDRPLTPGSEGGAGWHPPRASWSSRRGPPWDTGPHPRGDFKAPGHHLTSPTTT